MVYSTNNSIIVPRNLKQKLQSSSAKAVKVCVKFSTTDISFVDLHAMYHRATPEKVLSYKLALSLFKILNSEKYTLEWASLICNQIITTRQTKFITAKSHLKRVGINSKQILHFEQHDPP